MAVKRQSVFQARTSASALQPLNILAFVEQPSLWMAETFDIAGVDVSLSTLRMKTNKPGTYMPDSDPTEEF